MMQSQNTKKALLIGINYFGTDAELNGCHTDIDNIHIILKNLGFKDGNIVILKDLITDPNHQHILSPTKANILKYIKEIVSTLVSGDIFYIHYSGHGTWIFDKNSDEPDRRDETIYSVDNQLITDDELNAILVKSLPDGVKLRCVFDSCHSGSVLDLPYMWSVGSVYKTENYSQLKSTKDALMLSGSKDTQTSADAYIVEARSYQGAMTWAFIRALKHFMIINNDLSKNEAVKVFPSWTNIVTKVREFLLKGRYIQIPQLSVTNKAFINKIFDL